MSTSPFREFLVSNLMPEKCYQHLFVEAQLNGEDPGGVKQKHGPFLRPVEFYCVYFRMSVGLFDGEGKPRLSDVIISIIMRVFR